MLLLEGRGSVPWSFLTRSSLLLRSTSRIFPREPLLCRVPLPSPDHSTATEASSPPSNFTLSPGPSWVVLLPSPSPSLLIPEDPVLTRPVSACFPREAVGATSRSCGPPRAAHASPPAPGSAGLSLRRGWLSEPPTPCRSLQPLLPLGAPVPPPGGGGLPPGGWRSWAAGAPGPAVPGSSG